MVTCPQCGLEQERDQLFCTRCGTKLIADGGTPTMAFTSPGGRPTSNLPGEAPQVEGHARLNLHIIRSGQILPIGGLGEYIVGRVSEGQSILPDIDLEPFSGYESGVSRLHARIRIEASDIWITDLGSANGTHLNNEKLDPHHAYKVGNKDVVRLGRMSIQALVAEV
jgi:hypothetical protein